VHDGHRKRRRDLGWRRERRRNPRCQRSGRRGHNDRCRHCPSGDLEGDEQRAGNREQPGTVEQQRLGRGLRSCSQRSRSRRRRWSAVIGPRCGQRGPRGPSGPHPVFRQRRCLWLLSLRHGVRRRSPDAQRRRAASRSWPALASTVASALPASAALSAPSHARRAGRPMVRAWTRHWRHLGRTYRLWPIRAQGPPRRRRSPSPTAAARAASTSARIEPSHGSPPRDDMLWLGVALLFAVRRDPLLLRYLCIARRLRAMTRSPASQPPPLASECAGCQGSPSRAGGSRSRRGTRPPATAMQASSSARSPVA